MSNISSAGLGSGLDINGLVSQLIAAERQPTDIRLDVRETEYQAKLSSFGILKSSLSDFQGALKTLSQSSSFQARTTTSSDTTVLDVTSSVVATPGNYNVTVNNLALTHKLASGAFTATTDTVGTGTLTVRFGSYNAAETSFTVNPDAAAVSFTIDNNNSSLQGIRDSINAANQGVTANIINDDQGYKLVLSSQDGVKYGMEVTVDEGTGTPADNTDNTGLSQLVFSAATKNNISSTVKAVDASVTIDGLTLSRASNVITDAVNGLTLNLKTTGSSNVSVSLDKAAVKTNVESYVASFNSLMGAVNALTEFDVDKGEGSILMGDAMVRGISSQIRNITSNLIEGVSGTLTTLSDIGITLNSTNGLLNYDGAKLQTALDNNFSEVAPLFAAMGQSTDALVQYISSNDKTEVGLYDINVSVMASKGYYNGAGVLAADLATSPLTIDANNDTFTVKIDGVVSDAIKLTNAAYSSGANLAAEVQSQINADSKLLAQSVAVSVDYDNANNRLVITSNRYGAASLIDFQSVDTNMAADLGFSIGSTVGGDGKDVVGTINGVTAAGAGQFLTGAVGSASEGLKLLINGGTTGARGSTNFTRGYADQLNTLMDSLLKTNGILDLKMEGLQGRIDGVTVQRTELDSRITALEARYMAKFSAMDALLSQLQGTSSLLSQQLVSLESFIGRK
ncbi:MAG: flagellar filament capping protein FliD [Gammaproteobacteria bacterium]|nr:flagellar filament capping protein FliD [Gammaproteobacteria bacterium]